MTATWRWVVAFIVLFVAYQAPEGIGGRVLQNGAVAAALMLAFLPIAWLVARWLGRGMGTAYALEWRARYGGLLLSGFCLAVAMKAVALQVGLTYGIYAPGAAVSPALGVGMLVWLGFYTFIPSIAEDIVTRGFWARVPGWRWTGPGLVGFTAVLYVLNHLYRLENGPAEWLMLLCYGLAYGVALWRTGSLWAAVGLHWGWNFAGQAWDMVWPTELVMPAMARGLSGVAHLCLLVLVCLLWRRPSAQWGQDQRGRH